MAIIDLFREQAIEALVWLWVKAGRTLGYVLSSALYGLLAIHCYAYFGVIAWIIKSRVGAEFGLVWTGIGLILLYNIVFNHVLAMVIRAGGPSDLVRVEKLRKELKQREHRKVPLKLNLDDQGEDAPAETEDDRFEGLQKDVKRLMTYRNKTLADLSGIWNKKCASCNLVKPARTHHCHVCGRCIFGMDHHCPWINNCVGLENYRYFLLFLLYLWVGVIWFEITIISIWNHYSYRDNHALMSFLVCLDAVLIMLLLGFNAWSWFLACSGLSTLEFMR